MNDRIEMKIPDGKLIFKANSEFGGASVIFVPDGYDDTDEAAWVYIADIQLCDKDSKIPHNPWHGTLDKLNVKVYGNVWSENHTYSAQIDTGDAIRSLTDIKERIRMIHPSRIPLTQLKSVEFGFENCDSIKISNEHITQFSIGKIASSIERLDGSSTMETLIADSMHIKLSGSANTERHEFNEDGQAAQSVFDRLMIPDIVDVNIELYDKKTQTTGYRRIYLNWAPDDTFKNTMEKVRIYADGSLAITIGAENDASVSAPAANARIHETAIGKRTDIKQIVRTEPSTRFDKIIDSSRTGKRTYDPFDDELDIDAFKTEYYGEYHNSFKTTPENWRIMLRRQGLDENMINFILDHKDSYDFTLNFYPNKEMPGDSILREFVTLSDRNKIPDAVQPGNRFPNIPLTNKEILKLMDKLPK